MQRGNENPATVDSVSHQLGVLSGRFSSIEESIREISAAMKTIAGHSARVDLLEKARVQHDRRLSAVERENAELRERLTRTHEQVEKHIAKDVPVEMHLGRWTLGTLGVISGLVVKWLFDRLTR